MVLLTHWTGLRVGDVACLRWSDVLTSEVQVKDDVRLLPNMTKGRQARTVSLAAYSLASASRSCAMCSWARYTQSTTSPLGC